VESVGISRLQPSPAPHREGLQYDSGGCCESLAPIAASATSPSDEASRCEIGGIHRPATAYASTIDPNTQADSGILLVFAQLIEGCCSLLWDWTTSVFGVAESSRRFRRRTYVFSPPRRNP